MCPVTRLVRSPACWGLRMTLKGSSWRDTSFVPGFAFALQPAFVSFFRIHQEPFPSADSSADFTRENAF